MDAPDPRTRSQISLNPSSFTTGSGRPKTLTQTVVTSAATAIALFAGRQWLLLNDVGVFWLLMRVLSCGGIGVFAWVAWTDQLKHARRTSVEWTILGVASLAFLVQQATLLTALLRLSPFRILVLTHLYTLIPRVLSSSKRSRRWLAFLATLILSFLSDTHWTSTTFLPVAISYISLAAYAAATLTLDHTQGSLSPALGPNLASAATTLGAACLAAPLYGFRRAMTESSNNAEVHLTSLAIIPLLAFVLCHLQPMATRSLQTVAAPAAVFRYSFPAALGTAALLPFLTTFQLPTLLDMVTPLLTYYTFSGKLHVGAPSRTPAARLVRTYMKTILSNPESRKIFYFLMLNLAYMFVQMLYGVWTNSLGLISDAIHMAFDCMAIGVGLIASVMATWDPNERFTYGYGRIETLSGFANGIFLILISIFIIFEAIERLVDPPEMQTNQLLLVSSVGLGVNLFGLFAMGGHHGHSHGHSHGGGDDHGHAHEEKGHDHSHGPPLTPALTFTPSHSDSHGHSHDHDHDHDHGHGHSSDAHDHGHSHDTGHEHSHAPAPAPAAPLANGHSHAEDHKHSHGGDSSHVDDHHSHDHGHSHDHDDHSHGQGNADHGHSHDSDHGHSHNTDHGHSHDTGHGHSHDDDSHGHEADHGHSHDSDHGHSPAAHSHSHGSENLSVAPATRRPGPGKRNFSGPALNIPPPDTAPLDAPPSSAYAKSLLSAHGGGMNGFASPITPNYSFVHDEHYERVHAAESGPNIHSHGNSHSQAHDHEGHSDNMRGVFLHVLADTMGSVGVIISTLLIKYYGWTGFDPIASLFIAILIVASVVPLVLDTGRILALDVGSRRNRIEGALAEVAAIPGVAKYEVPRFWPKDGSAFVGSIRIRLAKSAGSVDVGGPHGSVGASYVSIDRVVERVDAVLRAKIRGLSEVTIEVEGE